MGGDPSATTSAPSHARRARYTCSYCLYFCTACAYVCLPVCARYSVHHLSVFLSVCMHVCLSGCVVCADGEGARLSGCPHWRNNVRGHAR